MTNKIENFTLPFWAWLLITGIALVVIGTVFGPTVLYVTIGTLVTFIVFTATEDVGELFGRLLACLVPVVIFILIFFAYKAGVKESALAQQCYQERKYNYDDVVNLKGGDRKFVVKGLECSSNGGRYTLLNEMGEYVILHESNLEK